jgi:alkyldihydroxyacetonephosphate synthase
MVRLSDYPETYFFSKFRSLGRKAGVTSWFSRLFKRILSLDEPCVLLVGTEGTRTEVKKSLRSSSAVIRKCKGLPVGSGPAGSWSKERFETPYLRDQLLAQGVGVDTLETSTVWSNMENLHTAVTRSIEEAIKKSSPENGKGIVMCHISHSYLEGASLYFTFLFPMDREDPLSQWKQIKQAASDTISREGGTISHHHGVGVDHVPWMTAEKGEVGIDLLKGAKDRLDPNGIMNPGKLLPNTTAE